MTANDTTTTDTGSESDHGEQNRYAVVTENIETGTLFFGTYRCETPEAAVRAVLAGDHQSPPSDPAHDIAAESAEQFTVYEITGNSELVSRTDAQTNGRWSVTEHGDTVTLHYDSEPVMDIPKHAIQKLITGLRRVYPRPDELPGDVPISKRPPVYDSFVDHEVGPIRIYPGGQSEEEIMWIGFTTTIGIESSNELTRLLELLTSLYERQRQKTT